MDRDQCQQRQAGRRLERHADHGAFAVATALAALVSLAMTALGIALIATDGSLIEQQFHSLEDWVAIAVFALLTAILVPTAIFRIRRLFARPSGEADHASDNDVASTPG